MARSAVAQVTQFGVETTPGTAVACNKRFVGLQVSIRPELGTNYYRATGAKVPSVGVLNQVSSSGTFNGPLTYSEIAYLLKGYTTLASSTQIGATTGYTHLYQPTVTGDDAYNTFTFQKGDSAAAQQIAQTIINSLQISLSRTESTVSGSLIGQNIDNAASLTSSPTVLANVPVSGNQWDVWMNSVYGSLSTTKLTDCFRATINFPEKYRPKWVVNSSLGSWKEGVEIPTEPTITVVCEYSSQMRAFYDALVTSTLPTHYIRVKAVGSNIGVSADYTFQMDFAVKLRNATPEEDLEGIVMGYTFEFAIVDDTTLGRHYIGTVVNKISVLT